MKKFIIILLLSVIVNNVSAAESFGAAADRKEQEVVTLDQEIQALTKKIAQLDGQLKILLEDPEADSKNMEKLATELDQTQSRKSFLEKEKEIKILERELSSLLVNPEIHQDRIVEINKRVAQLKKAYASSNIDDKEIPPFQISSSYLTHFKDARQKRKTNQTYKETQQKPLPTQLGTLKRDLEKLQETLKMQEDFIREQENQIKLLEQQDEENIKPLFNLEDFPYLNSYYKDFLAKNRFFSIKSQESLKEIKQKDRIRAEEKRKELIERLKKEIETKKILHQFLILEPLWFPTNHLFLNSALKKIYQLPNQQDDVDE